MDNIGKKGERALAPKFLRNNTVSKFISNDSGDTESVNPEDEWTVVDYIPEKLQPHLIALLGEFVGTFLFLFFAFAGTQVVNVALVEADGTSATPDPAKLLYISLCFGFSLSVNAWAFFRVSGGLFNPAVTLGMYLIGAVPSLSRAAIIIFAQLAGGIAASGLVYGLFPSTLNVATTLSDDTSIVRGLFIEMFLTAELVFTIFMLAAEKHQATFIAPVGIGLALFIAELGGVFYTGGSLNPARSFGPCVVLGDFPGYHWLYWLGPILGALLAVAFYKIIRVLNEAVAIRERRQAAIAKRAKDAKRNEKMQRLGAAGSVHAGGAGSQQQQQHTGAEIDLEAQKLHDVNHDGDGAARRVAHERQGSHLTSLSGETHRTGNGGPGVAL